MRWSGDDFAVLAAVTDDGEEVTLTGPLAHVHEGESLERRRRAGASIPSTAASSTSSACGPPRRPPRTRCSPISPRSSTSGPSGAAWLLERHGSGGARGDRPRPRRAARRGAGHRRAAAARGGDAPGSGAAASGRSGCSSTSTACRGGRVAAGPRPGRRARSSSCAPIPTRPPRSRASASPPPTRWRGRSASRPTIPARLDAGIVHALREAEDDGHCHLPRGELE